MPRTSTPLWLLTAALLLGFPAINFLYWPQVLESGVLRPEADSIGIPIFGSILVAIVAAPFVVGATWFCLRRYNPETRLLVWRHDRPWRTLAASLALGVPPVLIAGVCVADLGLALPWYEHLWTAYSIGLSYWLLTLRAAVVAALPPD